MNSKFKRLLSAFMASAMVMGAGITAPLAEDTLPTDGLLMNITFDEENAENTSFEAALGGTVTKHGSVSLVQSLDEESEKAMSISSNAAGNYLELPKGILNGKEAATFSFWIKPVSGWAFMTTPVSGAQDYLNEKYIGMLATSSTLTTERYNNSGTRLSSVITNGTYMDWQYVTAVFSENGTKVYVNGQLAGSDTAKVDIKALMTADASTWIGHGNWGSGEGFSGTIDDFRIYGKALTESEIKTLAEKAVQRETDKMLKEKNQLEIDTQFYSENGDKIFQYSDNSPVTITASVTNYTPSNKKVKFSVIPYDAQGNAGEDLIKENNMSYVTEGNDVVVTVPTIADKKVSVIAAEYKNNTLSNVVIENKTISSDNNAITAKNVKTSADSDVKAFVWDSVDSLRPADSSSAYLELTDNAVFSVDVTPDSDTAYYKVIVSDISNGQKAIAYDAGYLPAADVSFPDAAPADSADTTEGVHDPTIFKDPVSKKYYAYSTHNLVFESEDLINWEKHDYTRIVTIPDSARQFRKTNFNVDDTNTYWAPDIYYKEGDEYPYWFYLSSSGFSSQQSVISLVKAKSPGLWDGETQDCGVVIASNKGFEFNCIDANIFTDTDGKTYFFWGSFNRGIYAAELDTDTGRIKNIDYSSDATLLATSKTVGKRMFSVPGGVAGPEGPYVIYNEDTGYRYMFVSYGYLGTNYNTRVARTDKDFGSVLSGDNPHKQLLDYKNRPVGATFTDQVKEGGTLSEFWGYKISGSFQLGDGIEYLGSGHNSVFKDDDGQWYLVQHCRKVADGIAYLQVKKVLWTEDGWPVISPMVYAGEKEQKIPEKMLYGTWDLSSVGHSINSVATVNVSDAYRGTDLPVHSSQIILQADGTLGNYLGTWEFDGDHTVTISFEADGDTENYEFYQDGDTMKLYVLTGYDKDKRESALVMTGTDQNGIASFAKKSNQTAQSTKNINHIETTPTVVKKSTLGNPILGFDGDGNTMYAGDPAALVEGDTVYLYAGHDTSLSEGYKMPEWVCYSSKDMTNWEYKGSVMKATDVSWRNDDTSAWASQAIKHGDKYYLYFCTWDKTSSGKQSIGVAVSDSPAGSFVDKGTPLVKGTLTEPQTSNWNDIDPTVWVETVDGVEHRYLAWGNGIFYVCELNEDMTSVKDMNGDGQIKMNDDIKQQTFNNLPDGLGFTEAPWIYRQKDTNGNYTGKYYMFGAFGWREQMGYVTSDSMYGPWEWGGVLMPPTATSNTNHPSVIDFKDKTYFIYHNGSLPWGSGFRRVVCVERFDFNEDGSINPIRETASGLSSSDGVCNLITMSFEGGIGTPGDCIYHEKFDNPSGDSDYPIKKQIHAASSASDFLSESEWRITQGKANSENENYVSIEANDKPGLYICTEGTSVILTQQDTLDRSLARRMTFKTVEGLAGGGTSFESVAKPGYFLTVKDGVLTLSDGSNPAACTFHLDWLIGSAE